MRFVVVVLTVLAHIITVLTVSDADADNETRELLTYLFKNTRELPRLTSIPRSDKYPEIGLSPEELIKLSGYPAETHEITTDDGYILSLYRIPHGISNPLATTPRPVVFLMHGLFASSTCFLFNGVENSLAFLLAEQGYDVWLGNARGTTHSRKHVSFNPDDDKSDFWDFTWHEIGYYDVPASIDYVLQEVNQETLIYIGHSQGSTSFYVMASERPEYNEKIKLSVALAPVAFMANIPNPVIRELAKNTKILELIADAISFYEVLPHWQMVSLMVEETCTQNSPLQEKCIDIYKSIMGSKEHLNGTRIPVYLSFFPAGASIKQLYHYNQGINSGHFRKYDYGLLKNYLKYGRFTPPDYNLQNIITPVALYYSSNDRITSETDIQDLSTKLPNVVDNHLLEDDAFSHVDFLIATHVKELLYERLFALLRNY